jgi:DNA-binding transcriptional MerR regulator
MSSDPLLSIGELGRRVGASPSALRYWERVGLLETAERVGGQRRYPPSVVERVGLIRLCQDAGFHVGEIRDLLVDDPTGRDWRPTVEAKLAEVRREIAQRQAAEAFLEHVLACPHPSLAECPVFAGLVARRSLDPVPGYGP